MLDLTGYGRLAQLTTLTDRMINDASMDAVVTAARILAIQLGHYQQKFGAVPLDETIDLLESKGLDENQAARIADGLEILAMALASVRENDSSPPMQ